MARRLKEEMEIDSNVEVLVDNVDDAFNKEFAAWPIRYFIAKEGRLLHKTENSIDNDLFDQDSLQNFFRGFGFVRADGPTLIDGRPNPNLPIHELPVMTMLHFSSSGSKICQMLMTCCCSPCICIAVPCFLCVSKIRETIKRN